MVFTKLRQNPQIRSTELVDENLNVTDGYLAGQDSDGYFLQDDINYLRTAIKNLKGVDTTDPSLQQHFSSDHGSVAIVGDGYGLTKGLPTIDATDPNSINHALWLLNDKVGGGGGGGTTTIGAAEDGYYTDGLFIDFVPTTLVGTAVDRFNEILKELVPPPSPNLNHVDYDTTIGISGYTSFGTSNAIATYSNVGTAGGGSALDINGLIASASGAALRKGIYPATGTKTGTLADTVTAHIFAYPANSFGNGDLGNLVFELNGTDIQTTNLTVFTSGNSFNGNGSGFTLSAATPVLFSNSSPFSMFKYRTGSWTVAVADQRNGWNYMKVKHIGAWGTYSTNYFEWVVDAATTTTSFSGESLHDLTLTGSSYLSGVRYYTGGTELYDLTISDLHRNTYSASATAISHTLTTNCSVASTALSTIATEADQTIIVNKVATIAPDTANRILAAGLAVNTLVDRTVQTDLTSTGATDGYRILLDANIASPGSTDLAENFKGEVYRQMSTLDITNITYASGGAGPAAYEWDSTQSLTSGTAGHNTGLLIYNDVLMYPTSGLDAGDFRNVVDGNTAGGPTTVGGYSSNPNYNAASGNRTYLRYFYVGSAKQNFTYNFTVTSTTFVSVATGPSGNNLTAELLAPNTTVNGAATVVWKDMVTAYTTDASVGAFAASYGATIPTSWGVSLGTKSTATSGSVIVLRITAASGWTGSIDNITLTVL